MTDRPRRKSSRRPAPGTAPGTLTVPEGALFPKITALAYDAENLEEILIEDPASLEPLLQKWPVIWVNVDGLGSVDILSKLGAVFKLHMLALEDVVHLHQRPKTEQYEDYIYIATQMAHWRKEILETEQMSIFVGRNFVLTFQSDVGDSFDPVRARLKKGGTRRQRFLNPDYLAYTLLDSLIDEYFPILEQLGDRLDIIEDEVVAKPERNIITETHRLKRDLQQMRRNLWPMREAINSFAASSTLVKEDTRPFLRDCHDHVIQALDMLETYRERASGLVDIYLSSISAHMNEIMKVLTIITTIFIPISFIASIYGMNFDTASPWNMPELHWRYGYFFALGLMGLSVAGMLCYFRRKGWLGGQRTRRLKDAKSQSAG
jgi:magnesium transporter